jgi:gliding motility-associated-like protein
VIITEKGNQNTSLKPPSAPTGPGEVFPIPKSFFQPLLRFSLLAILLAFMGLPEVSGQWYQDYYYRKKITISASDVQGSGSHTNFPVLIDETHGELRFLSNEGLVHSPVGYDIVFTDSDGTTKLNHEVESWDASSGQLIAWVQVPTLSTSTTNFLYLYYGKPGIVVDPSTTATWDPDAYVAVYHLHDDFNDATANGFNATGNGTTDLGAKIADGEDFQEDNHYEWIDAGAFDVSGDSITISAWINPISFDQYDARIVSKADNDQTNDHWWMLSTINETNLRFRLKLGGTTQMYVPPDNVLSLGSWQYVTAVYDDITMNLYHNGSKIGSGNTTTGDISTDGSIDVGIGNQPNPSTITGGERPFDGTIDEVRIQKVARSLGWLETEYSNQDDPTNFHFIPDTAEVINDTPCESVELTPVGCFSLSTVRVFSNLGATDSGEGNPGCNYGGEDVWFKVGAGTNPKLAIEVGTTGGIGWTDTPNHSVYTGTCGSLTPGACYSENSHVQPGIGSRSVHTGLSPGDTLYIRIWDDGGDDNGKFAISIMNDLAAPTLVVPADLSVECIGDTVVSNTGEVTNADISDVCDADNLLVVTYSDVTDGNTCPEIITRTWSVEDLAGNITSDNQSITVHDLTPATITGSIAVSTVEGCAATDAPAAVATVAALEALGLTITDVCDAEGALVVTSSDASLGSYPIVVTRTWRITDDCGNTTIVTQTINVDDSTSPVFECPADLTENIVLDCEFSIPDYSELINLSDDCDPLPSFIQFPTPGTVLSGSGTFQEIVLTANDANGNESTCSFNLLLLDNTPPEAISLSDTSVIIPEGVFQTSIDMPLPVFTDNCGIFSVTNDFNGGSDASGIYQYGSTTVVYTVTDINNNTATFNQQVVVGLENELENGLVIPEAFSPNEDGLNDRFEILGIEQYPENDLYVYNVNGIEVFYMKDYDNSWDGTSTGNMDDGNKLPTGTYYYVIYLNGKDSLRKGFVYLRKE